jgi:hypothetical protein
MYMYQLDITVQYVLLPSTTQSYVKNTLQRINTRINCFMLEK